MPLPFYLRGKILGHPLERRLEGARIGVDAVEMRKFLGPAGKGTPAVQPVACRYTD
jgi:hypothetical protein